MANRHLLEEQLIDYVLENLDESESVKVKNHLGQCRQCRVELESWHDLLTPHRSLEPSEQLKERLRFELDQIEECTKKPSTSWQRKRFGLGLVIALAIFLVMIVYSESRFEPPSYEVREYRDTIPVDLYEHVTSDVMWTVPVHQLAFTPNKQWMNRNIEQLFPEVSRQTLPVSEKDRVWISDGESIWIGELKEQVDRDEGISNLDRPIDDFNWLKIKINDNFNHLFQPRTKSLYIDLKAN